MLDRGLQQIGRFQEEALQHRSIAEYNGCFRYMTDERDIEETGDVLKSHERGFRASDRGRLAKASYPAHGVLSVHDIVFDLIAVGRRLGLVREEGAHEAAAHGA